MRLFLTAIVFACLLPAQTPLANISGVVQDPQGAVIANAEVVAVHVETGVRASTRSNHAGFYSHRSLPIGPYRLTCEMSGFRRYVREGIVLSTGADVEVNVQLEIGAVTDSVTVTTATPLLETRNSTSGQLIENHTIEDIPLGDRRSLNVVRVLGEAVIVSTGRQPQLSLAGGNAGNFMFMMDGGTGQNMRLGSGQVEMNPPVEGMEEMKVLANNYGAEYGAAASGVIIVNTKSGTNHLKGSLFEYLRNDKFDAAPFFAPIVNGSKSKAPLRYNVFGGAAGGPIRKNRTFFFVSSESARSHTGVIRTYTVPTELQKAGDFSQTTDARGVLIPIYDPSTNRTSGNTTVRDPFPGNRIPTAKLDPVGVKVVTYYPVANRVADTLQGANNFRANAVNLAPRENILAKVDENLGDKDKLTGRFIYTSDNETAVSVYPVPAADPTQDPIRHQKFYYGAWTRILSAAKVNDLRVTIEDRFFHNSPKGFGGDWVDKLGLRGVPNQAFPALNATGFVGLGQPQDRLQFPIRQFQFSDNFNWIHGRHAVKFGGEGRRMSNTDILSLASGTFAFSTTATGLPGVANSGNGLASLLVGFPTSFSARQTPPLARYSWYIAGFVQDDWTVHKNLTLNIGVRWETDTPTVDRNNRLNAFDTTAINPVSGTPGVLRFAGQNGVPNSTYDGDWNNFGPRFGFAWKAFGSDKTVVRGGFGVFFSHPGASTVNSASLGYEQSATINSPDNGITAPFFLRNGVPNVALTSPVLDDSFGAVKVGQQPTTAVTFYDRNRPTGYAMQYNLGVQRQLSGHMVLEVAYVANVSRKLPNDNLSINQIAPDKLKPGAAQKDRPYPQFSGVTLIAPPNGSGSYNSGLVRIEKRFSGGLSFQTSYTWSKLLNNVNAPTVGDDSSTYSDFYNRAADWGPDGNDIRHRFTWSSVYQLPFGKGRPFLSKGALGQVVGNWSVGAIVIVQSAAPFTVTTQTNTTNAFSAGALRADVVGDPKLSNPTLSRWFDTDVFKQPAAYTFGNEGVNILRGDRKSSTDLSIIRSFPFTENIRLQFRGELLNAFNHPDFGQPGKSLGGSGFGLVSSADSARTVQLGLRLTF
jgi:hypothetical protein